MARISIFKFKSSHEKKTKNPISPYMLMLKPHFARDRYTQMLCNTQTDTE